MRYEKDILILVRTYFKYIINIVSVAYSKSILWGVQ